MFQREGDLFAQPFDTDTATLSGTPVPVASSVGEFPVATAGLWSIARNGTLVYRSGGVGLPRPVWIDSMGRELSTVGGPGLYVDVALSPDGTRLAVVIVGTQGNSDIWVTDSAGGENTRLTFDPGVDTSPAWSPDGKRVAFAASRNGRRDIYVKNADGSGEEQLLLHTDQDKFPTSWSHDGRFLLFESLYAKTRDDIWVLPLRGRPNAVPLSAHGPARKVGGVLTRWAMGGIRDDCVRERGNLRASVLARFPIGEPVMQTRNGWFLPPAASSRDGVMTAKVCSHLSLGGEMMAADVQAGVSFQSKTPRRLLAASGRSPGTLVRLAIAF